MLSHKNIYALNIDDFPGVYLLFMYSLNYAKLSSV